MLARTVYSVLFVRDTNDDSTATVDEPASLMMLLAGLVGLVMRTLRDARGSRLT